MKIIKKNIYKILIAISLCLTLILTLTFTTKTYADTTNNGYEIYPNRIVSKNLWNLDIKYEITESDYLVYNKELVLNSGEYTLSFFFNGTPSNAQIKLYTNDEDNPIYNNVFNIVNGLNTLHINLTSNTTKILIYTNSIGYYRNIMLNTGSIALNYIPYGVFYGDNQYDWNEDIIEENENLIKNSTTALYNALNGAYAELIGRNGTILASGYCNLEENTRRFDIGNLPISFSNYYNNYDSENDNYYTRPDIKIYLNYTVTNSLLFSFTDTALDRIITLQNSNNTNSVTASNGGNEDMIDPYTLIINKENIGFDIIYYNGVYIPDYWDINFNISFDAYTYSQGYTKGVESQQSKINIAEGNANYYKRLYEQTYTNYEELQDRYNQINENGNTLYGMIVAIADTPINIFKQIFNFDILGINISGVVFGLISLLVIIWLIKKLI